MAKKLTLPELLKRQRMSRGWTQPQAALELGVPLPTYRKYEQGAREPLGLVLVRIAAGLGVNVGDLACLL